MMEVLKNLSADQKAVLKQFKENIKDCKLVDPSDDYIVKWLIARNFNMEESEKMIRLSIEWRKANRIDEIVGKWEPPVVLTKYYPMGVCGQDKFACPVWINAFGSTDFIGILQSVSKRDYLRYVNYLAETNMHEMRKNGALTGKPVTYQTWIIDMEFLSMRQMAYKPTREVGIEATKMAEANYPECLRRVFVLNAPKVFTVVFAMIKPFLHQGTLDKIRFFGCDKDEWKAALLDEINPDQLPVYYGGKLTDPNGDPRCPSKCNIGGEVPESYYLNQGQPKPKPDMIALTVPSGSRRRFEFNITIPDSILKWEFLTENCDIGFLVYYVLDGKRVDLVPNERVDSHLIIEEGELVCSHKCVYSVEFDNSFSYVRSKKVWYKFTIEAPSDSDAAWEEFDRVQS